MRKKILGVMMSFIMALGFVGAIGINDTQADTNNIALGKNVNVSSVNGGHVGANAVDGDSSTYWQARRGTNELIVIDLGAKYYVDNIKINWGTEGPIKYNLHWGLSSSMGSYVTYGDTEEITGETEHTMN